MSIKKSISLNTLLQACYLQLAASLLMFLTINASAAVLYVDVNSTNATPPYTNWTTAAVTIQNAVDAATDGDEIVVTNGVYQTGAQAVYGMSNRVAVTKPLAVRSVNGPEVTVIQGYQVPGTTNGPAAIRCVFLTDGAVLAGFTLTNGATQSSGSVVRQQGGGVWCQSVSAVLSNCLLTGNSAYVHGGGSAYGTLYNCTLSNNSCGAAGGAAYGTLSNCTLSGNSATLASGGGALGCTLYNCTLTGNKAFNGGGVGPSTLYNCVLTGNMAYGEGGGAYYNANLYNCTLTGNSASYGGGGSDVGFFNCIVYYNSAPNGANYYRSTMRHCCTTPLPSGAGNFTNHPLFLDTNGWSNLRLQSNSPCINAGTNGLVTWSTELDGNRRIVGGTVDMGAYECQSPALLDFYLWLESYGQPTQAGNEYVDLDGDLMNNWQEWIASTDPTNSLSVLRMLNPTNGISGVSVSWQSVNGRSYFLERGSDLGAQPPFLMLNSNIVGQAGTTTFIDTNAVGIGPLLYRVGVQP